MIGLESVLSDGWGLESALKGKKIRLKGTLSDGWGIENALKRKMDRAQKHII